MKLQDVARAARGIPVGVARFDTSLADIPKVIVELCSVGTALVGLLRAAGLSDSREHLLQVGTHNSPCHVIHHIVYPAKLCSARLLPSFIELCGFL